MGKETIVDLKSVKMTEKDVKSWIQWFMATGQPVHPVIARKLYLYAGLPLPDHLIPTELKYKWTNSPIIDKLMREVHDRMGWRSVIPVAEARRLGNSYSVLNKTVERIKYELFYI